MTLPLFAPPPEASSPVLERIAWRTDVQRGSDGTEQRTQLRLAPWFAYSWQSVILPVTNALGTPWEGSLYAALLRSGGASHPKVRVPLYAHAVPANKDPVRGVDPASPVIKLSATGTEVLSGSPDAVLTAPTATALLSLDRTTRWDTDLYATCRVEARLINHFETGSNPDPTATAAGLALASSVLRPEWTSPVEEIATLDVLRTETWNAFSERGRYETRDLSLDVVARGEEAISALRAFLFACRGQLNAFAWTAPVPGLSGLWRLKQDVVEIAYHTRDFAQTRLTLTRV